jgi:hydrogenase maturation protease
MAILVLGLGNTIMTDDGFGVRAVETLSSRYRFQGEIRLCDGGILGLDLLPSLE